jgi:hypothetical protein
MPCPLEPVSIRVRCELGELAPVWKGIKSVLGPLASALPEFPITAPVLVTGLGVAVSIGAAAGLVWLARRHSPPTTTGRDAGVESPTAEAPESSSDAVHFTVSSPPAIQVARTFIVYVWAHMERQRAEVACRVREASPQSDAAPVLHPKGPFKIERGTTLFVRLRFPEFHVESPEDAILWVGEIANASFEVAVPRQIAEGVQHGSVTVYWEGGLRIAKVPLQIKVVAESVSTAPTTQTVYPYSKAFASYANEDRNEVLRLIQGMQKIAPSLNVFLDVASLRSGEDFEKKLLQVIPENETFYLFWSAAAKQSSFVEKEWRCALNCRGEDFIDPVPLVSPEEVRPPEELGKKHFNDWTLAYQRGRPKGADVLPPG